MVVVSQAIFKEKSIPRVIPLTIINALEGKLEKRNLCTGCSSRGGILALHVVNAVVEERSVRALIDIGCSHSALAPWVCVARGSVASVRAVNGDAVCCVGSSVVTVSVGGVAVVVECVVSETLVNGTYAVLGWTLLRNWVDLNFAMER
ncbi:hypothetical protein SK128_022171 [Halocaridina rubra]|uniref:Uncharacterized protein n=1 Tax=Halocaridina rubra TaxID=373956 RepID=A0AAN9A938_HALRR